MAQAIKIGMGLVFVVAGLALALGFDRLGHRAEILGLPMPLRVLVGLWQLAAGGFLLWPGRAGYGAAMGLAAASGAVAAHLTVLGLDSAPPAAALALGSALILWRNRADLRR